MGGPTPESLARPGSEAAHQTALFCWAALNTYHWPELELLHHIPNGGSRNKIEAGFLKAQGVRSGVPDVSLPVSRWRMHGLYIELKRKPNDLSQNQSDWLTRLHAGGYAVAVAYSWCEARDYITAYLDDQAPVSSSNRTYCSVAAEIRAYYSCL